MKTEQECLGIAMQCIDAANQILNTLRLDTQNAKGAQSKEKLLAIQKKWDQMYPYYFFDDHFKSRMEDCKQSFSDLMHDSFQLYGEKFVDQAHAAIHRAETLIAELEALEGQKSAKEIRQTLQSNLKSWQKNYHIIPRKKQKKLWNEYSMCRQVINEMLDGMLTPHDRKVIKRAKDLCGQVEGIFTISGWEEKHHQLQEVTKKWRKIRIESDSEYKELEGQMRKMYRAFYQKYVNYAIDKSEKLLKDQRSVEITMQLHQQREHLCRLQQMRWLKDIVQTKRFNNVMQEMQFQLRESKSMFGKELSQAHQKKQGNAQKVREIQQKIKIWEASANRLGKTPRHQAQVQALHKKIKTAKATLKHCV